MVEDEGSVRPPRRWSPTRTVLAVSYLSFVIWTGREVFRHAGYTGVEKFVWLLVLLFSPIVGPTLWHLVGRRGALPAR